MGEAGIPLYEYCIPSFETGSSPKLFAQGKDEYEDDEPKTDQNDKKTSPPKSRDNFGIRIISLPSLRSKIEIPSGRTTL